MTESNQHDLYADHGTGEEPEAIEMMAARYAALDLLHMVLSQKRPLDEALDSHEGFKSLPGRDKAFCRMLVSTCLRRLGQVDDIIRRAEERPGTQRNLVIQDILRLGVTQICFMDVPDHAAVDTSVRLADAAELDKQKGFVNGVLRTVTRKSNEWLDKQDGTRLNTPDWLLKTWIEDYDLKPAATIAKANLTEAPLDISIKDREEKKYWLKTLDAKEIGSETLRRPSGGAVRDLPGFDDGMWWVQDASAALPVSLFGDIEGKTVVDLCSAPGGKTMQLAARGAKVIAVDRSAARLQRLKENIKRIRLEDKVKVEPSDAAHWKPREAPHYILLDAPCSATGTVRRHPDILHLKTPRDVERLVGVQIRILENAFNILAPGGTLIYCTCSLQKAEGEYQIQYLLDRQPKAMKKVIKPEEVGGWKEALTDEGDLRILPFHREAKGGMDGFFISRITKAE